MLQGGKWLVDACWVSELIHQGLGLLTDHRGKVDALDALLWWDSGSDRHGEECGENGHKAKEVERASRTHG